MSPSILQVRQYFTDPAFFSDDASSRGACSLARCDGVDTSSSGSSKVLSCDSFEPSAATVKVSQFLTSAVVGSVSALIKSPGDLLVQYIWGTAPCEML